LEVLELGLGKAALQVLSVNVLDDIPTDAQVLGHILDGHEPAQLQGIAGERLGIAAARFGKIQLDLPDPAAGRTRHAGDGVDYGDRPVADRHGAEAAFDLAAGGDLGGTTRRTAALIERLGNVELDPALDVGGAGIGVAADPKGVIQQTRGHAATSVLVG